MGVRDFVVLALVGLFTILNSGITHSADVGKWAVFEVSLTASGSYSNPYTQCSVQATFTGPTKTITINGFWDGRNAWKVRMAPTEVGAWSYTTSSSDSGLNAKTGSFNCIESGKKGFIKVNPNYPYSFMYDDGTPFFWMGDTSWKDPGYTNFTGYIDIISQNGYNNCLNYVSMQKVQNEGGLPFEWISTNIADRDKLRPEYFKEYDKRVICANSKNIIPQLVFVLPEEFLTFTRTQFERYEKYIVARYSAYNVGWIISGEYNEQSTPSEYAYHGNIVYQKDPYKHLISIHPTGNTSNSTDFGTSSWLSYIMQQMGFDTLLGTNQYILNDRKFNKPVVNGEAHYLYDGEITVDTWRKQNWLIAVAGGYFTTGYQRLFWTGYYGLPFDLNVPNNLIGMTQMKYLSNFFNSISFWNMNPNNSITSNGYAFANLGTEYIIYLPSGGSVSVDLSAAPGTLNTKWYNPRTGTYQGQSTVTGGATRKFTAPDTNDWVLYITAGLAVFPGV